MKNTISNAITILINSNRIFLIFFILFCVTCSRTAHTTINSKFNNKIGIEFETKKLYFTAKNKINNKDWKSAHQILMMIKNQSFGIYAQQILIDLAYVNWKIGENEAALSNIDIFQKIYPDHIAMDYMLYLKGSINLLLSNNNNFLNNLTGQNPFERDLKYIYLSYKTHNELIERFPNSKHIHDSKKQIIWLTNIIVMNEIRIGRYYYQIGAYLASINRLQKTITDFGIIPITRDAIEIIIASYKAIGLDSLCDLSKTFIQENFSDV